MVLVFVRPNSSYVRPKLKLIGQMSCQVKYLFAALPYYDEVKILKATIAYKRIKNDSPNYLDNMLKLNSSVNSRSTRYCNLNFLCPKYKHRLSKDRCVTSVKKLSHGRHLPSKCRSRDYSSFGSTSLPSKMFSTPFLQL